MSIDLTALRMAFDMLLYGWPGLFLVMLILYAVSLILLKVFPKKKQE